MELYIFKKKKRKRSLLSVFYYEVTNMTEKEKQFEERLDALILLKALLIKNDEFDEVEQKEYQVAWNKVFELLD